MKAQTFGVKIETTNLGREGTTRLIASCFGTTAYHDNQVAPMLAPDTFITLRHRTMVGWRG